MQLRCRCLAASPAGVPDRAVRPFLCFSACLFPCLQRWWAEKARKGTFNEVIERDGLVRRRRSPSCTPSPAPRAWTPQGKCAGAAAVILFASGYCVRV